MVNFSFGELDVADEVGIGYFLVFGGGVLRYKEDGIVTFNMFGGGQDLPPPCVRRKKSFVVEIYQVALLGPDQRVWREDLMPVMVLITALAVPATGRG